MLIGADLGITGSGFGGFAIVNHIANSSGRAPPSTDRWLGEHTALRGCVGQHPRLQWVVPSRHHEVSHV